MPDEQRRNAERITLKQPITAMIADMEVRIVEISLIGGRIEHVGRLNMNSNVTLQFRWQNENVKLKGKISRTEMRPIGGKPGYSSGVDFATKPEESPVILQRIVASFIEPESLPLPEPASPPPAPPPRQKPGPAPKISTAPAPFLPNIDDEVEEIGAEAEVMPYVKCTWVEERWVKERTRDPKQPMQGFTMIAPDSEDEIDAFCRTFEVADPETQRMIRLSFELGIARDRQR
ncbi:MAG TPA: PilZ domain-containing protein [Thermoanaerobaculia bacterium]|nr:PilZ domain-containing protein [Thermoanaerobaculia bacterium]